MRTIDVICPVFREEEAIDLFHDRLSAALQPLVQRYQIRILYVLDPSPDGTEIVLSGISANDHRVEVLVMSRRFGHQAALIAGIDHSRGDAAIMLDSDLQHPPELIPRLVELWEQGAEIVQAVRIDGAETGALKRLTSRWFYRLFQKLGVVELPAGASDYRLLSRRVAEVVRAQLPEQNPFLRGLVGWLGFKVANVPFKPAPRERGRSHYRTSMLLNFALNGICSFSKVPLRFCIGLGLAVAGISVVGGIGELLLYALGRVEVPGWPSLIAALCFLGGIQLFFLGVIGEYVGLIFDEVKGRPRYIVDRRYAAGSIARCEGAERFGGFRHVEDERRPFASDRLAEAD
jgi:polyisoprenyl-phosphate glycosyltransferase